MFCKFLRERDQGCAGPFFNDNDNETVYINPHQPIRAMCRLTLAPVATKTLLELPKEFPIVLDLKGPARTKGKRKGET